MGSTLVLVFLGVFAFLIGGSILRRVLNPFQEVAYEGLPTALRSETDRVLPGFLHKTARTTKNGDNARIAGEYLGESITVEADFDPNGEMVEFEVERWVGARSMRLATLGDVPDVALREVERVLGDAHPAFEVRSVKRGEVGDEVHFEVEGTAGEWKWEVGVTAAGRLVELEKEKRRRP